MWVLLQLWALCVLVAVLLAAPIVHLGRRRARWRQADLLLLVVPYAVWLVCSLLGDSAKSLSNLVVEFGALAVLTAPLSLLGVCLGDINPRWLRPAVLVLLLSVVAGLLCWLVPILPE